MLTLALRWDLSPLRPWEFWRVDAREWNQAEQAMSAYKAGIEDADEEQAADRELRGE